MFKKYNYHIDLASEPFANLKYRDRTVLILCKDGEGNFVLGSKSDYYPKGISRMIGGGVDKGEEVSDAAKREIKEELGIRITNEELVELIEVSVTGKYNDKIYKTKIYVYFLNSDKDDYVAGDDISDLIKYTEIEYRRLVKRFLEMPLEPIRTQKGDVLSWRDFGKVYGFIHQKALEELLAKEK